MQKVQCLLQGTQQGEKAAYAENPQIPWWLSGRGF